jgi:hypothetical protein
MKSFTAAVNASDERLLRYAEPNVVHDAEVNMAARLMDASPKVRAESEPKLSDSEAGIAVVLIEPVASVELRAVAGPQEPPPAEVHRRRLMVGTVPPCDRS